MKKREIPLLRFYEFDAIADHLSAMAAKGWQLEGIGNFGWVYHRAEPARRTYAVTYFAKASEFDPAPGEAQLTYMDFCRQAGWEPVARWAQMQIFVTDRPDPVALETDEALKLETIHAAMRKNYLPGMWGMLAIGLLQLAFGLWQFLDDPVFFLLGSQWISILLWGCLGLHSAWCMWQYRQWRRKSRASVEAGGDCLPGRAPGARATELALLAAALLGLVLLAWDILFRGAPEILLWAFGIVFADLALTMGVKQLLKAKNVPAKYNRLITLAVAFIVSFFLIGCMVWWIMEDDPEEHEITCEVNGREWVLYQDELPLRVEDLRATDYPHYSTRASHYGSILLSRTSYNQSRIPDGTQDVPTLRYEVMDIPLEIFYELCLADYLDLTSWSYDNETEYRYVPVDPAPWGAEAVYRLEADGEWRDERVLCWEDRIVEFTPNWELTEAQMAIVGETLGK